jgi:glycosyltransferase involved in cell wall biosynthesis
VIQNIVSFFIFFMKIKRESWLDVTKRITISREKTNKDKHRMKLFSLSILIPAYKDEGSIATVVRHAVRVGNIVAETYEIVVIDDASPDKTGAVLDGLKKTTPHLRVIHHRENKGYGETMKELYCSGSKQWFFTTPGDFQIDPFELLKLVPYACGPDMVIGWREKRQDSLKRKVQSQIFNRCIRLLFGVRFHDINSVRLMKRTFLRDISIDGSSAFVDAKMTLDGMKKGQRVIEVPITHRSRETAGASGGKLSIILPVIRRMATYARLGR